ncbi:MAG: hypothetical protein LBE57_03440 [Methanosarcinales archaeon]|jgi:hypothetical protein|nr:hypothetical protein [Methanosarcinales archaeon]
MLKKEAGTSGRVLTCSERVPPHDGFCAAATYCLVLLRASALFYHIRSLSRTWLPLPSGLCFCYCHQVCASAAASRFAAAAREPLRLSLNFQPAHRLSIIRYRTWHVILAVKYDYSFIMIQNKKEAKDCSFANDLLKF